LVDHSENLGQGWLFRTCVEFFDQHFNCGCPMSPCKMKLRQRHIAVVLVDLWFRVFPMTDKFAPVAACHEPSVSA